MKLLKLIYGQTFYYQGRRFKVIRHQDRMTEVVDSNGKFWAWPSQANVKTI